jgi:hypothetical protein
VTETATSFESLLKTRRNVVEFITVPEFGYAVVGGTGAPESDNFAHAVQALYSVSYGAHFLLKRQRGQAPRVMPLETLWWVEGEDTERIAKMVALDRVSMADTDRDQWCWQAMIMQPDPLGAGVIAAALQQAREKKQLPGLARLHYVRWAEGPCAQLLHVGPYSAEGPSIARLHRAIADAGYRPRGRHHEIYLSDPRRCAPEKLRTIVRQPVEAYPG